MFSEYTEQKESRGKTVGFTGKYILALWIFLPVYMFIKCLPKGRAVFLSFFYLSAITINHKMTVLCFLTTKANFSF